MSRPNWWGRLWRIACVLLTLLMVLWLLWWWLAERRLAAVRQDIVAAGLPTTMDEVLPPLAGSDNAARHYEEAYRIWLKDVASSSAKRSFRDFQDLQLALSRYGRCKDWTEAQWVAWRQLVGHAGWGQVLAALEDGSRLEGCQWERDYRTPLDAGPIGDASDVQKALSICVWDPELGKLERSELVALGLRHALHQAMAAAFTTELLVARANEMIFGNLLVARRHSLSSGSDDLLKCLRTRDVWSEFALTMDRERIMIRAAVWAGDAARGDYLADWWTGLYLSPVGIPFRRRDETLFLEFHADFRLALDSGMPSRSVWPGERAERLAFHRAPLTPHLIPAVGMLVEANAELAALCELIAVASGIDQHHQRTGNRLDSLDGFQLEHRFEYDPTAEPYALSVHFPKPDGPSVIHWGSLHP